MALSQAALEYKGRKAPGTEVVKSVNNLLQVLGPVSKTSNALDGKLADYVFFPLSHLFQESDSLPPGAIKISLQCLQILISQGWRLSLSPGLFKQLLMLLSFLPRGSAANAKGRDVDEDLSAAALDCLTSLFDVSKDPLSDDTRCIKSENIPILGHLITVILEALSDGPSPKVQNAALNSLKAVISSIHDQQALASFLPGIVSSTTKVLQPKTQGRRSYRTLQGCLDVLAKIIRETIGDDKIREIRQRAQVSTKTAKPDEPGITEAWVKATSSQLKLALANVVRLQYHETSDVQNSLFELCLSILQNCRESLSGSAAMMIEALLVICAQDFSSSERAKLQALNNLATTDRGLLDLLKALLHDRIVSLPRLMQSNDDISKSRSMAQIVSTLQVLSGQRMDYKIMEEPLAEGLRGSAVAAIHASSSKASDLISDQSLQVISASSSKSESIRFGPVLAGSTSQKVAAKGINRILMQLHATSSLPVLKRKFVDDIRTTTGDTQLASFWLSFTILEHASSHAMDVDQLLNLPPRMKSGDDGFQDAIYSFAIDTLSTSIVEDENDWRLQAISLETVALQARQDKLDFRPELVDALYPVVERIGSENSLLRDHAMTCLNILSHECGYSSPSDLIFQNVDYLVNTIALKFNTFDISPQGPQVLVMMIKLCGAPLLPYLDDIVESMFSALANFHSYSSLVESLFSVFTAIIEETNKTVPPISPSPHLKQPYHSTTIAELAYTLKNLDKPTDPLHPSFSAPDLGPSSDLPSDSLTAKSRTDSLTSDPQAQSPPFTALLPRIVTLTQHYLTHPSSPLRLSLCGLLTTAFEPLSRDEDTFLPLIHALWPVIIPRLYDRESFVAIAAANTIGATCRFAGDFMSLRIQDEWAQWEKLFLKLDTQVQSERKRRRGRRDIHSTTEKMWEAMVSMTLEVVMHVRVTKEMEDSIIEILTPELLAGRQDVRSVLEGLNADAVWLVEEMERLRRGGKPLQRPEGFEEWEFKEVTL